jgi:hypothetical protein
MMNLFQVVLAVSAPFLIGIFVVHYFRYRSEVAHRSNDTAAHELAERNNEELRQQLAALRERVEVLEAIVTDKKYDLSRKIANL